jgi:hypothetical protein
MLMPDTLRTNILSTYFTLRWGIVVMSGLLPVLLYAVGRWQHVPELPRSMSAYYEYDGLVRDVFVGTLCAVGSFLYLYKGFSTAENVALNLAGIFAVGVAFVPCDCLGKDQTTNTYHIVSAVSFFLSMAFVCLFCADKTLTLMPDPTTRAWFTRAYRAIGVCLVLSPAAALAVSYALRRFVSYQFFVEAFGVEWAFKSVEFRRTSAEERAARGELATVKGKGVVPAAEAPPAER